VDDRQFKVGFLHVSHEFRHLDIFISITLGICKSVPIRLLSPLRFLEQIDISSPRRDRRSSTGLVEICVPSKTIQNFLGETF
jgi:hypothetical protein